jgi:hypothetical protein
VISIAIIGLTVVVIVGALTGLISSTQQHRGNVVAESATRNVTQAVLARTQAHTTLTSAVGATAGAATLAVTDAADFAPTGFISVDLEVMRVTARTATTISVVRGAGRAYDTWPSGDPDSVVSHAASAPVGEALMCAKASEITPSSSQYVVPTGVTVTVSAVEYWDLTAKAFVSSRSTCIAQYQERCTYDDQTQEDLRLDCDAGLQRVTLSTSTAGDSRYKGVTGSTQFLIRRASA